MIEKMHKYTFILYHLDYLKFLADLQKLGMVHIIRSKAEKTEKMLHTQQQLDAYMEAIKLLKHWIPEHEEKGHTNLVPLKLRNQIEHAQQEREKLQHRLQTLTKEIAELEPWGNFMLDYFHRLEQHGLQVDLFFCTKNHFKQQWAEQYAIQDINLIGNIKYFAILHKIDEPVQIDAEPFKLPHRSLADIKKAVTETESKIQDIETFLTIHATIATEQFTEEINHLSHSLEFEDAALHGIPEAENHVHVLQGWLPEKDTGELESFIRGKNILYFHAPAKVDDNPPILLKNNWFARKFEPIGNMFMLPYYNELDLTPFLAPFYMMFFGFCSGDTGYGIILFLLGWLLKRKFKNPEMQPFLTLIQTLGIGTVIMGFVMGSFFSFDMKKITWLEPMILMKNTNQIFNFALLLGFIQILTGKTLNAIKHMLQSGFVHGLSTLGMVFFIASLGIKGSTMLGANPGALLKYTPYGMYLGLAMIFLLNMPGKNIFLNVANGIWIMYGVITGFFGDLLSYIRLFALGVSGGILGFVINTMALQFMHIHYVGPVLFILFMLAGHGLNIALSSLGAFVHPMRLTFVEFFNNSGFSGPGMEYKPFGKRQLVK